MVWIRELAAEAAWPRGRSGLWRLLPLAALWLLALFCGTFPGAASAAGATASQLLLLALLAIGAAGMARPSRSELAAAGLLWLVLMLATAHSEVPRAGRVAVALWPAFAILPRLVAHLFAGAQGLRLALRGSCLLLAVVAGWGLYGALSGLTPGASLPLGHHNLLAALLLLLLPAACAAPVGAAWGDRALALSAGGLGVAALIATRSVGGSLAFLIFLLLLLRWRQSGWRWLLALAATAGLLLLGLLPRLLPFATDWGLSTAARWGYQRGGWQGFLASPWLGHGPGSTPWLFARYFEPAVAVHPPDHAVGDLHNLPLQLLFELGLVGALAAAGWLLALLVPLFTAPPPAEPLAARTLRAARAGLSATLLFSSSGLLLSVPALPFAFVWLAGLAQAAAAPGAAAAGVAAAAADRPSWRRALLGPAAALLAFAGLWPGLAAQWAWERALRSTGPAASAALAEAVRRDPDFPLYRARLGLLERDAAAAARAEAAAGAAPPLTLVAGLLAEAAGDPQAAELLTRACDLDPFGGLAPFRLAVGPAGGDTELRVERAMRALVAEPRLAAAAAWRQQPEVLQRAQVRLDQRGVPPFYAAALLPSLAVVLGEDPGAVAELVLRIDRDPAEAVSLHLFRRSPWPAPLFRVRVHPEALPGDLPPAVADPALFPGFAAPACRWRSPGN